MEKEYCYFFFQGVVRIIGIKNSKPRWNGITQKTTTDTNKLSKPITGDLWAYFNQMFWSWNTRIPTQFYRVEKDAG